MSELSNHITYISEKVHLLVDINNQQKQKNASLSEEIVSLKEKLTQSEEKLAKVEQSLQNLTVENNKLKTVQSSSESSATPPTNEVVVSKKELEKMINEIDECLSLWCGHIVCVLGCELSNSVATPYRQR